MKTLSELESMIDGQGGKSIFEVNPKLKRDLTLEQRILESFTMPVSNGKKIITRYQYNRSEEQHQTYLAYVEYMELYFKAVGYEGAETAASAWWEAARVPVAAESKPKPVLSQVHEQIARYEAITSARGGESYHSHLHAKFIRGALDNRIQYSKCVRDGAEKAGVFLLSCRDTNSADYKRFRSEFKNSETLVKRFFIARELRAYSHEIMEFEDKAYEAKVFRGIKVVTDKDQEVADLFADLMLSKWSAVGYDNDYSVITSFWSTHSLSSDQIPGIIKMSELIKKSAY